MFKKQKAILALVISFIFVFAQMTSVMATITSITSTVTHMTDYYTTVTTSITADNPDELNNSSVTYNVYKDSTDKIGFLQSAIGLSTESLGGNVYKRDYTFTFDKELYSNTSGNYSTVAQVNNGGNLSYSNEVNIFNISPHTGDVLNFSVTDSEMHPTLPILYMTDLLNKKLYSLNYETQELKSISFEYPPESMTFANNELYVSLLITGHDPYTDTELERGAIAIIDPATFTVKEQFNINLDPFDIAVSPDGFIYVTSGSSQWTLIKSFNRTTKSEISSSIISQLCYMYLHPTMNRLYTITTDSSPRDLNTYNVSSGTFLQDYTYSDGYDSPYHGDYPMNKNFKISPDGKYIFNGAGTVFISTQSQLNDMKYAYTLNNQFTDIAFDLANNRFYTAISGNMVAVYDYRTFEQLGTYSTTGSVNKLYFQNNKLVAISKNDLGNFFVENIDMSAIIPVPVTSETLSGIKLPGTIVDIVYDKDQNKAYAIDIAFNNLYIINLDNKQVESTIPLSYRPSGICISEDGNSLFVINTDDNNLVSEISLSSKSIVRNLQFSGTIDCRPDLHKNIYNKNGKIYIVGGEWAPKLWMFDATTFAPLTHVLSTSPGTIIPNTSQYSMPTTLDAVGDLAFSSDNQYLYYWYKYGWDAGYAGSHVYKYSIDNATNTFTWVTQSVLGDRDPIDSPIILLENKGQLINKKHVLNINNLSETVGAFNDPIYVVDEARNLAISKNMTYDLSTYGSYAYVPVKNADNMFLGNDRNLYMLVKNKSMLYYSDLSSKEITAFQVPGQVGSSVIDPINHTVTITMPEAANVTALRPAITISAGALVNPVSTTAKDFTTPVAYTITAPDGSTQNWVASVVFQSASEFRTVSGTISLGSAVAPVGGINVTVNVANGSNSKDLIVNIPEGESDAPFVVNDIVAGTDYRIKYTVEPNLGYVTNGYYSMFGTTTVESAALLLNLDSGNIENVDLLILGDKTISGLLKLPDGEVAPQGGMIVYISAVNQLGEIYSTCLIPAGENSTSFSLQVPSSVYKLKYEIDYGNVSNKYENIGYFSTASTVKLETAAESLDITTESKSNIDITILKVPTVPASPPPTTSPTPTPTPLPTTPIVKDGVIQVTPVINDSGVPEIELSSEDLTNAFEQTTADSDGTKTVVVDFGDEQNAEEYVQELPASYFSESSGDQNLEIRTPVGTVQIPDIMFKSNDIKNAVDVTITISTGDISAANKGLKKQIGDRPIIDINASIDGKSIEWKNNSSPVTISIAYEPTEAEMKNLEHIVVWYIDDKGNVKFVPNGRYNPVTGMVTFTTTHFSKYAITYVEKTFEDITESEAKEKIETLTSKGIISGTSQTTFSPDKNITRADFTLLLVKGLGLTADIENNFSDIKVGDYYYEAVGIAKKLGIVSGTGKNSFNPKAFISRQDMMVIMSKALKLIGKLPEDIDMQEVLINYSDSILISEYAKESAATLINLGIVKADSRINPKAYATREEVADSIYNAYVK